MPRTRTLAEMTAQVRSITDQTVPAGGDASAAFITDAEIAVWLHQGAARLYAKIVRADPDFYLTTEQLSTTSGTLEYNIPDLEWSDGQQGEDLMYLRGVDLVDGTNRYTLKSFNFQDRNRFRNVPSGSLPGLRPRYRLARNAISGVSAAIIFDRDPGTNTYDVHFIPHMSAAALETVDLDGVSGWEDYAVFYAATRCRAKADEDASAEERELARLDAEIFAMFRERHIDGDERMTCTRRRRTWHPFAVGHWADDWSE
jgi:hypothetical protein